MPVPPHLWHLTILSPFLSVPLPSQFLHGRFFSPALFFILSSRFNCRMQGLNIAQKPAESRDRRQRRLSYRIIRVLAAC
jgi:hypothetical protein